MPATPAAAALETHMLQPSLGDTYVVSLARAAAAAAAASLMLPRAVGMKRIEYERHLC